MPNVRPRIAPIAGYVPPTPNRISPQTTVSLVDGAGTLKLQGPPTNQDILNAIHDLSKKVSQISKNQQCIESMLGNANNPISLATTLDAIYSMLQTLTGETGLQVGNIQKAHKPRIPEFIRQLGHLAP